MKALILNSGMGGRLQPLTRFIPKALIEIDSKPLLGYQLDRLKSFGITSLIITTGPFSNKIMKYVQKEYPSLEVNFVKNLKYRTTNYIYSMWLAKNFVDDDILLLHGDLLFEKKLLDKVTEASDRSCVLVSRSIKAPEKDFKAVIENGRVAKIGVEFSGENVFFMAPLYKFTKSEILFWLNEIDKAIRNGETKIYAENVFNRISGKLSLFPVYFDKEMCMEIDTKDDLDRARALASNLV